MEDAERDVKVVVSLPEIQFLELEDGIPSQEKEFILRCIKAPDGITNLPGGPGKPWQTPRVQQTASVDFGSATAVFNSLQGTAVYPGPGVSNVVNQPQQPHISLPPYMTGIPLPGSCPPAAAQHIHINNFTANLNFPAGPAAPVAVSTQSGPASLPPQPLPFTVGYPSSGPYVAPFPQPSPSPPIYHGGAGGYQGHFMVYQPPLHLSMYPQYPQHHLDQEAGAGGPPVQVTKEPKEPIPNIMFGSTPVVSVRHSSSDEEPEEPTRSGVNVRAGGYNQQPVKQAETRANPTTNAQDNTIITKQFTKPINNTNLEAEGTLQSQNQETTKVIPTQETEIQHPDRDADQGAKSWASLFTPSLGSSGNNAAVSSDKPTARITPFSSVDPAEDLQSNVSAEDLVLSKYLCEYNLQHIAPAFLPRGLTNRSNWCFVNSILQALLACPPFYNLMKNLPVAGGLKSGKSTTPMIDSIVEFVNEMAPLETMNKNQKKDKARKKEDLPTGNPLEPSYVYKTLLQLESETFKVVEGRQEDAEEFLTCLLNMINDEMMCLVKVTALNTQETVPPESQEAGDWQEVNGRGRSQVTRRINGSSHIVTPLQQLALGLCRYSVKASGSESSATLQPFYTLQLDIQRETVKNVTDALAENFASEILDGYICSRTKKPVEASSILSLEELPPILILHLKRFVYSGASGGCQKVMKHVEFSVDLEISRDILSVANKSKYTAKQRQYKLFAVVNHTGREATKGHYVADVYHTGYASWLHCDDSIIQPTAEQLVTSPAPHSTPYILFYRRGDTMVGVEKTVK